ncbi:hypothetical protein [Paenibacillus xanthanilyticus]|uniref:Uncharacterized protein n=1 Tax=Paenibacillus xanthanilyticus TaxID=1783531 RepID=A0ABV8K140_9BACL
MDDRRRKAYLTLNYQAFLDIKNGGAYNEDNWNRVFRIAHAFHNLAWRISEDFEGFNEEEFWANIAGLERVFGLTHYRELFERVSGDMVNKEKMP